ncbi:hypothetical protein [Candidatus Blastococcus massiliensis]|uniref:hypothetical protein n=1 Tax=Candidatus Blastococcus massiliensis TaxID=1470358 RepID=UPI000590B2CF|nr:hypothetical protein [Candidatus Blastococcus massiliensis]
MAVEGVAGHAFGSELGERLWEQLSTNTACRAAALTRLEDLRLFIDGVGYDLISDLATRVVFEELADFTTEMMNQFPQLQASPTVVLNVDAWDLTTSDWMPRSFTLPDAYGPLLLVPKDWVYWRTLMDTEPFYNRHATRTVQDERATFVERKRLVPSKKSLREEFPNVRELNNRQAAKRKRDGVDLVEQYRQEVDAGFVPLDDDELHRRTDI